MRIVHTLLMFVSQWLLYMVSGVWLGVNCFRTELNPTLVLGGDLWDLLGSNLSFPLIAYKYASRPDPFPAQYRID